VQTSDGTTNNYISNWNKSPSFMEFLLQKDWLCRLLDKHIQAHVFDIESRYAICIQGI
jgi:hypothetical protein